MSAQPDLFTPEDWAQLPTFFNQLPRPVQLHLWADPEANPAEAEAVRLAAKLTEHFDTIDYRLFPRRINYDYYPVFGVMNAESDPPTDDGVRLIGLPTGYQMTALIAAIQSVAFRGMTSEAKTRIQLHRLKSPVTLELITTAEDEAGPVMAQIIYNLAAASPHIKSYLIMGDAFPQAVVRYSVTHVPHLVINGRSHLAGPADEEVVLQHIAAVLAG